VRPVSPVNSVLKFDFLLLCLAWYLVPYDPLSKPFHQLGWILRLGIEVESNFLAKTVANAGKSEGIDGLSLNMSFALGFVQPNFQCLDGNLERNGVLPSS
jgi:hypothetical protein